jgi:hypothetical protein
MKGPAARREFCRSLEMTIGREEFLRLLPGAVGRLDVDGKPISAAASPSEQDVSLAPTTVLRFNDGRGTLRLIPLPNRRLGSVTVSRHRVEIALEDCSDADGEAFMVRFHRAFLRGGG